MWNHGLLTFRRHAFLLALCAALSVSCATKSPQTPDDGVKLAHEGEVTAGKKSEHSPVVADESSAQDRVSGDSDGEETSVVFVETTSGSQTLEPNVPAKDASPLGDKGGSGGGSNSNTTSRPSDATVHYVNPTQPDSSRGATSTTETEPNTDESDLNPSLPAGSRRDRLLDEGEWTEFQAIRSELGTVYTAPGDLPHLEVAYIDDVIVEEYIEHNPDAQSQLSFDGSLRIPLSHTHVDARLVGPVARVHVLQKYKNPYSEKIEAVYVFPLPENSAVDGMRMVIGERVIEGVVKDRATARAIYEEAKAQGKVAALLEQDRPNVFSQSVANIAPGMAIDIDIRYVQDLTYDSGGYEFVFPMVVGPRYLPQGTSKDDVLSQPLVLGRGLRPGQDISLSLSADAGVPIQSYESPTHELDGSLDKKGRLAVELAKKDELPNRDFVLRYQVAGEQPQATVLSEKVDGEGYFTLVVQPPEADVNALVGTREMVFVVDVSGSMAGVPLALTKEAIQSSLRRLRPVDTFNIVTFSSGTSRLFETSKPANKRFVERALEFVDSMESGGGTEMKQVVKDVLEDEMEPGMSRILVFVTDGFIGNEEEILSQVGDGIAALEACSVKARVFVIGVGSSTNRYLIDGLAKVGNGAAEFALDREDPALAVDSFFRIIDHPILTDVSIDFKDLEVDPQSLYPAHIPDLMASKPLVLHGRYGRAGKAQVVLKARSRGEDVELPFDVELSSGGGYDGVLGTLWARSAIESLERDLLFSYDTDAVREQIVSLAMAHSLVSRFTSFVAVDSD